jgi:hypothetical protein
MHIGMDHTTQDHMLYLSWLDSRSLDRLADDSSTQLSRWLVLQSSAKVSNGGAHATKDDDFWLCHVLSSPFALLLLASRLSAKQ